MAAASLASQRSSMMASVNQRGDQHRRSRYGPSGSVRAAARARSRTDRTRSPKHDGARAPRFQQQPKPDKIIEQRAGNHQRPSDLTAGPRLEMTQRRGMPGPSVITRRIRTAQGRNRHRQTETAGRTSDRMLDGCCIKCFQTFGSMPVGDQAPARRPRRRSCRTAVERAELASRDSPASASADTMAPSPLGTRQSGRRGSRANPARCATVASVSVGVRHIPFDVELGVRRERRDHRSRDVVDTHHLNPGVRFPITGVTNSTPAGATQHGVPPDGELSTPGARSPSRLAPRQIVSASALLRAKTSAPTAPHHRRNMNDAFDARPLASGEHAGGRRALMRCTSSCAVLQDADALPPRQSLRAAAAIAGQRQPAIIGHHPFGERRAALRLRDVAPGTVTSWPSR